MHRQFLMPCSWEQTSVNVAQRHDTRLIEMSPIFHPNQAFGRSDLVKVGVKYGNGGYNHSPVSPNMIYGREQIVRL
jgi:hypothetical protein